MAEQMKPSGIDWIKDIPSSWEINKVKYLATEPGTLFLDGDWIESDVIEESGIRYLTTGNVGAGFYKEQGSGYISEKTFSELHCLNVYPGDLMISRLNEPIGRSCIIPDTESRYVVAVDNVILRPNANYNKKFIMYGMNADGYAEHANMIARGATMSRISRSQLGQFWLAFPNIEEQQAIADFLDKECAQIDSIAADLEKQIALLQQYKKSLITETVTKGLDKSVPMKDSGVEWIGEIPEHWEISRVRHLASLCSGATPSKDVLSYWEGNTPWVSSQEVKSDIIKDTSLHISEEAINSCSTQLMPAGTLVMVVRSGILQHTIPVALLGVPATINQDIKAFQFNHLMLPAYFKYYIQGENDALLSVIIKDKTTVESVDNQLLLSLKIMVPPIEEQKAIVAFLNYKCGYIDKILNDKQEQLNLLMQHKKSLIYEYVTGKKRVKEVQ